MRLPDPPDRGILKERVPNLLAALVPPDVLDPVVLLAIALFLPITGDFAVASGFGAGAIGSGVGGLGAEKTHIRFGLPECCL